VVGWVSPAWDDEAIRLCLERGHCGGEPIQQQVLSLTSVHTEAESAAHDIIEQLRGIAPEQWPTRYGWRSQHR
jgi:hypothetical protein